MKQKILELYHKLPPEARAGICGIVADLTWAAEHDPAIIPAILDRPSEIATIEKYSEEIRAAVTAFLAETQP